MRTKGVSPIRCRMFGRMVGAVALRGRMGDVRVAMKRQTVYNYQEQLLPQTCVSCVTSLNKSACKSSTPWESAGTCLCRFKQSNNSSAYIKSPWNIYLGTCEWGESALEAPRLHLQRLGRSGRIHFLSGLVLFALSWMALLASFVSSMEGSWSTLLLVVNIWNAPSRRLASPLVWLSNLAAWGHTGPLTVVSLDEGTDGMAYTCRSEAALMRSLWFTLAVTLISSSVALGLLVWMWTQLRERQVNDEDNWCRAVEE